MMSTYEIFASETGRFGSRCQYVQYSGAFKKKLQIMNDDVIILKIFMLDYVGCVIGVH